MSAIPSPSPKLVTVDWAREFLSLKSPKTIRNMIGRGELTAYRIAGVRGVRVDENEVRALVKAQPARFAPKQPYGPKARIVDLGGAA